MVSIGFVSLWGPSSNYQHRTLITTASGNKISDIDTTTACIIRSQVTRNAVNAEDRNSVFHQTRVNEMLCVNSCH